MRNIIILLLAGLSICSCTNTPENTMTEKLVGKWYNPFTYQHSRELKGFNFKKDGTCEFIGVNSVKLDKWQIKGDTLIVNGKQLENDGMTWTDYYTEERIEMLNEDTLRVIAQEKPFKLTFLYVRIGKIKENTSSDVQ